MSLDDINSQAVLTVDEILRKSFRIEKALDPQNRHDFLVIQMRISRALQRAAGGDEAEAVRTAINRLDVNWRDLTDEQRDEFLRAANEVLTKVPGVVLPRVQAVLDFEAPRVVGSSKEGAIDKFDLNIASSLSLRDERVARFVSRSQGNFIRDQYGKRRVAFSEAARRIVSGGIDEGLGRDDIAEQLRSELEPLGVSKDSNYWRVIAGSFVGRARSETNMNAFDEAGIARYRWDSVLDEATCFAAGTLITMATGHALPIERVRPGDRIFSCRGRISRVIATKVSPARSWIHVRFADDRAVCCTSEHLFLTRDGWRAAKDLRAGCAIVFGGHHARNKLSSLWKDVPKEGKDRTVLLGGLPGTTSHMRLVWQAVPHASLVRRSRSRVVLLGILPPRRQAKWSADSRIVTRLRDVRKAVSRRSFFQAPTALFARLPKPLADGYLRYLWRVGYSTSNDVSRNTAFLLGPMLPAFLGGDVVGAYRVRATTIGGSSFRARGEDRTVVRKLPATGKAGTRSGRCVLAQHGTSTQEGQATRSRTHDARVRCLTDLRSGPARGSIGGSPLVDQPWPYPKSDFAGRATFVQVASVERFVTAKPEPAYDIQVEHDAGFLAADLVVHNSEICRFLHGQEFTVQKSLDRFDAVARSRDPEEIKDLMPWGQVGTDDENTDVLYYKTSDGEQHVIAEVDQFGEGERDAVGEYSNALDEEALAEAGLTLPPAHGNCRSTVTAVV